MGACGKESCTRRGGCDEEAPPEEGGEEAVTTEAPSAVVATPARTALVAGGVCALLALQNSSYTLLRRYVTGVLKEDSSSQSILAVGEVLKMSFCFYMALCAAAGNKFSALPAALPRLAKRLLLTAAPMCVPALVFLAMNLLSFVALARISASAFTLIQQSKLIATAVLSRLILLRRISLARWRALLTLLCAVLIICDRTHPEQAQPCAGDAADAAGGGGGARAARAARAVRAAEYAVGVCAVGLEAVLSGFSNVYFEKVLKGSSVTLWERNVQLAGFSLFIYVPMAVYAHPANPLEGWSALTCVVAFLGALGGVLIGLVISYLDSVSKNVALGAAIVLTAGLEHVYFAGPMNLPIVSAAAIVVLSILSYSYSG